MQLCHTFSSSLACFDEPTLVSSAGLVPVLALADRAGLRSLADERLTVPTDKGSHAGAKVSALVAGMARCAPLLPGVDQIAYLDIDDTIRATHGYAKQGAGYGYSGVKGLNALI